MDVREKLDLLGAAARYDDCRAAAPDAVAEGRGFFAPEPERPAADPRVLPCISICHTPEANAKPPSRSSKPARARTTATTARSGRAATSAARTWRPTSWRAAST